MKIKLIILCSFLTLSILKPIENTNRIGCLLNQNLCELDEYCLNDSLLGICITNQDVDNLVDDEQNNFDYSTEDDEDFLLKQKSLRSEQEIDTITPYIKTPIRVHKYSKDNSFEQDQSEESNENYWQKRDDSEDDRMMIKSPLNLLLDIRKRPSLSYFPYKALNERNYVSQEESDEDNTDQGEYLNEPQSIDDLIEYLKRNNNLYTDTDTNSQEYDMNDIRKRSIEKQDEDDTDVDLEMFYLNNRDDPKLYKWVYINNQNYQDNQEEAVLLNRLKTILKENIIIENMFNSIIENISNQNIEKIANLKKIKSNDPGSKDLLLVGVSSLNGLTASNNKSNLEDDLESISSADSNLMDDFYIKNGQFDIIDGSYIFIQLDKKLNKEEAEDFLKYIALITSNNYESFQDIKVNDNLIVFKINPKSINSTELVNNLLKNQLDIFNNKGYKIVSCGIGRDNHRFEINKHPLNINSNTKYFYIFTIVTCSLIGLILVLLFALFIYKRKEYLATKLISNVKNSGDTEILVSDKDENNTSSKKTCFLSRIFPFLNIKCKKEENHKSTDSTNQAQDYQELCRQRMQATSNVQTNKTNSITTTKATLSSSVSSISEVSLNGNQNPSNPNINKNEQKTSESSRSSTSSWSEEPINSFNIDITTGHVILAYMEENLNDKNRLNKDWDYLSNYQAEPNKTDIGSLPINMTKNRYSNVLPYDHTRVKLNENKENYYINANFIIDDDPKNPAYIATQGPLIHTSNDFWEMVWEQRSVVIVSLCRTVEYGSLKCNQYWPCNGFEQFEKFEIHLVSEHVWCEDYLVRNFFLKNLETNQTRTITQFHYLTWPENGVPQNIKSVLDFRRKVNKSYKSKSSPLIVHCNDGIGRTGTYMLIDMVLNKIQRGAKEIDLAATLEFLRDQRPGMVKNKSQFEFSFGVVTEEVQNMLKAITQ